jgi:hypothetical protein
MRNVLRLFLASPGGLEQERRAAKDVVDFVNDCLTRTLDWEIDLLGWEDTIPGFARPQELINRDVDVCDLFVGLLWKRWGEPTGTHSSGFYEEYSRAVQRRQLTRSRPEIWLFLKEIDASSLADPGEQLQQVIAFREQLKAERQILFNEFLDVAAWQESFRKFLLRYVLELSTADDSQLESAPEPVDAEGARSALAPKAQDEAERQVSLSLATLKAVVDGEEMAADVQADAELRVWLRAASSVAERRTRSTSPVHEINLLYLQRSSLQLGDEEEWFLFRSLVADRDGLIPGWYWIRDWDPTQVQRLLVLLATISAHSSATARNALRLLACAKIRPTGPGTDFVDLLASWLDGGLDARAFGALELLTTVGTSNDLVELQERDFDPAMMRRLDAAGRVVEARENPSASLTRSLEASRLDELILSELREQASSLSAGQWQNALSAEDPKLRALALQELGARDQLTQDEMVVAIGDSESAVRLTALKVLFSPSNGLDPKSVGTALGSDIPNDIRFQKLRVASLADLALADLHTRVSFLGGSDALEVIAMNYFDTQAGYVRELLNDDFRELADNELEPLRVAAANSSAARETLERIEDLSGFATGQLRAAVLSGLAEHGDSRDVAMARKMLAEDSFPAVVTGATRLIAKFGAPEDAPLLLAVAEKASEPEVIREAVSAMLRLNPDVAGPVGDALGSSSPSVATAALDSLDEAGILDPERDLVPLLDSSNQLIRRAAASRLVVALDDPSLEALLTHYLDQPTYYYNVVAAFDGRLYAPAGLAPCLPSLPKD